MKKILVTGGTVFVSKYVAQYFKLNKYDVYVLNRGSREQLEDVNFICADRNKLGDLLKDHSFDVIVDVCAYNQKDIKDLLDSKVKFKEYIFISSSAVYPETNTQPFVEEQDINENLIWGQYGLDKIAAERELVRRVPKAYILRPAYLYGPMQNIYRESFVFDCALKNRKFYIPEDGKMQLQFYHVDDLCKVIEKIIETNPKNHIFNIGNTETIDINTYVEICYKIVDKHLEKVYVTNHDNQRDYFSFHNYEYKLDVSKQNELHPSQKDLFEGLKESYDWYKENENEIIKKDYIDFLIKKYE